MATNSCIGMLMDESDNPGFFKVLRKEDLSSQTMVWCDLSDGSEMLIGCYRMQIFFFFVNLQNANLSFFVLFFSHHLLTDLVLVICPKERDPSRLLEKHLSQGVLV